MKKLNFNLLTSEGRMDMEEHGPLTDPLSARKRRRRVPGGSIWKRMAAAGALACLLTGALTGCGTVPKAEADQNLPTITVGCDTYSPFSYVDVDGNLTGIDIELAKEAFSRMGYVPEFTIISWEDKKDLLHSGEIDCIWSSFTIDGREDEYQWAGPYMRSHQVVAVNVDSDVYTLQDLEGKVMAVQSATKPEDIIRSHDGTLPQLRKVISVQKRDLIFALLGKGYADALAAHDTSVEQFMTESGLEFRVLDQPLLTVGLGVAFDKEDARGLSTQLTQVLNEMRADGTTRDILSRYVSDPDRYLEGGDES